MTKTARISLGAGVSEIALMTNGRSRPGWQEQVASLTAHPGFMKTTGGEIDTSLTHQNGWDPNDYFILEQDASNLARMVVEPGESTVVWYVDNTNGLTATAIADAETAAGRPTEPSAITSGWIKNQTTTDYGKHPDRPIVEALTSSAFRDLAQGLSPWMKVKAGTSINSTYVGVSRGESLMHPAFVETYGEGDPANVSGSIGGNYTSYQRGTVVYQGLDVNSFYSNNVNYNNLLFSDIVFGSEPMTSGSGFGEHLTFWATKQSHIIKEVPKDGLIWKDKDDRSSGMYLGGDASKVYQRYSYFDHNGWDDSYALDGTYLVNGVPTHGQPPSYFSHNQYMSSSVKYQSWVEVLSLRSPFSHLQKRSGGEEICCAYARGNAYGVDSSGYTKLVLANIDQVNTFDRGQTIAFSDSEVTAQLDPGDFWKTGSDISINVYGNLPAGFDPVGRTVTSPQGGSGVIVDYKKYGSYSAKTAVVISEPAYKAREPITVIGKRDSGFNGLENTDIVMDWVALIHAVDPNDAADQALKAGVNWSTGYYEDNLFHSDVVIFNWGSSANDLNASGITTQDRNSSTIGAWVDDILGVPLGTTTGDGAADWLDSQRNPGLRTLDYIDFVAQKIGKPSPKRTVPGPCLWTAYERLSGHNADQPQNWSVLGVDFTWPIDGDDLILGGGKPHWVRTCRAVDISLAGAEPVIYGGLMSSSGEVSGNGKVTLKNGGQFWYLGTNTGTQQFDGDGGRLGIGASSVATGLDVRVGDAGLNGATEVVVLAGASAGFATLHLTGKATLKLDGLSGTAAVTIGDLRMAKSGTAVPRIGKIRSGHFGINPTTGQPYNPSLTGNVTITGTITAAGYAPGDVVLNGSLLDTLTTTGATFVGCAMSGNNIVAS